MDPDLTSLYDKKKIELIEREMAKQKSDEKSTTKEKVASAA